MKPYFSTDLGRLYQGNSLEVLAALEPKSVDVCFTSPPYWGLRNYGTEPQVWDGNPECSHEWGDEIPGRRWGNVDGLKGIQATIAGSRSNIEAMESGHGAFCQTCGAWRGDLGMEPSLKLFIQHLCDIFDRVRRVLKPTGAMWIDIGDSYAGSGGAGGDWKHGRKRHEVKWRQPKTAEVPRKSRCAVPERLVVEMLDHGWTYRNHCIWEKNNVRPESALDRFTQNFDDVFFFTLGEEYYFKTQRERSIVPDSNPSSCQRVSQRSGKRVSPNSEGRIARAIWSIYNAGFEGAHTATFPIELLHRPLAATLPPGGTVLDPFMGSGTVAEYAERQGAHWIGIELSPANCEIIRERVSREANQIKMKFEEEDAA